MLSQKACWQVGYHYVVKFNTCQISKSMSKSWRSKSMIASQKMELSDYLLAKEDTFKVFVVTMARKWCATVETIWGVNMWCVVYSYDFIYFTNYCTCVEYNAFVLYKLVYFVHCSLTVITTYIATAYLLSNLKGKCIAIHLGRVQGSFQSIRKCVKTSSSS